jgi:hypothetical protein
VFFTRGAEKSRTERWMVYQERMLRPWELRMLGIMADWDIGSSSSFVAPVERPMLRIS